MKLEELFEFRAVPAFGPDASRPTPVTTRRRPLPLPHELCQDRDWCEDRERKRKKSKKVKELENRYSKERGDR